VKRQTLNALLLADPWETVFLSFREPRGQKRALANETIIVRAREFSCPSKIVINFITLTANWRDRAHGGKLLLRPLAFGSAHFSATLEGVCPSTTFPYWTRRCLIIATRGKPASQMASENFGVQCTLDIDFCNQSPQSFSVSATRLLSLSTHSLNAAQLSPGSNFKLRQFFSHASFARDSFSFAKRQFNARESRKRANWIDTKWNQTKVHKPIFFACDMCFGTGAYARCALHT
jgi:hypothetical protein